MKTKVAIDSELKDLVPKFLKTLEDEIENMESCLNARDFTALIQTSHRLRGDAPGFGFTKFGELCGQIEDSARDGELKSCEKFLAELKNYFSNMEVIFIDG